MTIKNMNHSELSVKTSINDIETKQDKNFNLYFKLAVKWNDKTQVFYAFSHNLPEKSLTTLKEKPEQFINQLVLITYQELPNQDGNGTFYKVKGLEVIN
jgi:hypothetical protein